MFLRPEPAARGALMAGPLDGLVVVDATRGMPGSVTSMILADYGATVLKIEALGASDTKTSFNRRAWERGKSSIQLGLGLPKDRVRLRELIERADVFCESSGVKGLGTDLGFTSVTEANPTLIYCSFSGYGLDETPWRDRPGWDGLVAARMGFMAEQPGHRKGPIYLGHPSIGYTTALIAVIGILSARRSAIQSGHGQLVDVSLLDGILAQSPMNWWWNEGDASYLTTESDGTFGRQRLVMDIFKCSDGEHLMVHTGGDGAFKSLMDILGVGESVRTIEGVVELSVPLDDAEYKAARTLLPNAWLARPRDEWLTALWEADVAAVPVLRPGEILNHEQVRFADLEIRMPDPDFGFLRQVGPGIKFGTTVPDVPRPAPGVGADNDGAETIVKSRSRASTSTSSEPGGDHALSGLRVLDFSQYFAGAYGVKIFSDLGADVIKIEPPSRDPMRSIPDPFEAAQRGKRAITIDLRRDEGRAVVRDLVAGADVVVHNLRPGKAEKIGIGYEDFRAINPSLIYCYQPGWGSSGPWKDRKSFAPLMSGITGLMYEAAGAGNSPVRRARASEDYYGGLLGAAGILMALEHRAKTGQGQYLEAPQLHASLLVTTEQQLDPDGNLVTDWTLDSAQTGLSPLYGLHETKDGWIAIACVGQQAFSKLKAALDLEPDLSDGAKGRSDPDASRRLSEALEQRFHDLSTAEAFEVLDSAGVPCEIAQDEPQMPQFFWEEWALESQRVFEHHHAEFGWIREVGLTTRFSRTPGLKKGPAPLFGEHTLNVLEELGYSAEKIEGLVSSGSCVPNVVPDTQP
jgi:crotonobetainyl-CoA:carnitine CoA-transferase CaiB-like acyl-CoA transferase